jgi:integrase
VVPRRIPKAIPDELFNKLFAVLSSNRALVAFWISTGVRAFELLGARLCDMDPGQQLITVVRKGSRAVQQVPASTDAFVWLRLYQEDLRGKVPRGRVHPVWWTLRQPFRPLTYHGAHRMFEPANAVLGANWTLHDLRHSAATRMARDPQLTLTDVQWVLGHAHLTTTELYLTPTQDDVGEHQTPPAEPLRLVHRRVCPPQHLALVGRHAAAVGGDAHARAPVQQLAAKRDRLCHVADHPLGQPYRLGGR